jgi:hypothetical protein
MRAKDAGGSGLLTAGAATKVPAGHDEVALLKPRPDLRVSHLKQMFGGLLAVRDVQVPAGVNEVGIDVVSQHGPDAAPQLQTSNRHGALS